MAKVFKHEKVTIYKDIFVSNKCDICEKETTEELINVNAYHEGWGNDSIESHENYECCSCECYKKTITKFLEDFEEYEDSAFIDGKPYSFIKDLFSEDK